MVAALSWAFVDGTYHDFYGIRAKESGDLDLAIACFAEAYERNPNASSPAYDCSRCYALKEDRAKCIKWLRRALAASHGDWIREKARTEPDFRTVRETREFQVLMGESPSQDALPTSNINDTGSNPDPPQSPALRQGSGTESAPGQPAESGTE